MNEENQLISLSKLRLLENRIDKINSYLDDVWKRIGLWDDSVNILYQNIDLVKERFKIIEEKQNFILKKGSEGAEY